MKVGMSSKLRGAEGSLELSDQGGQSWEMKREWWAGPGCTGTLG